MKLWYNTDAKAYIFDCTYDERHVARDAEFVWDRVVKGKWATKNPADASKLMRYATPQTEAMLRKVDERAQTSLAMSRASDMDIDLPVPDGLEYLPYQKVGIHWATERVGTLLADDMGLGKTIQVIGLINNDPTIKRALIVCPASLRLNWKRELEKWLVRPLIVGIVTPSEIPDCDILICNYDILHRFDFGDYEWDLVAADEAHYTKNKDARRSKALHAINGKRRVAMTGTPIANRPVELFPIISWVDPDTWPKKSFFQFAKRYCDAKQGQFGWNFEGASNLGELQEKLRSTCMIRRKKDDVLKDLPPKRRSVVVVPANGDSALVKRELSAYEAHRQAIEELRAERDLAKASGNQAEYKLAVSKLRSQEGVMLSEMSKLRAETAIALAPKVVEHVKNILEDNDGYKIIIFAHHKDVVWLLQHELMAYGVVTVTGDTSMNNRQHAVDTFQQDPKCQVFIGNIQAAGVGLTLTASAHVVFAELDWVPGNVIQAEDRAHRYGQKNMVLVEHVVMDGSLGAKMAKTIIAKQEVIDRALDTEVDPNEMVVAEDEPSALRRAVKAVAAMPEMTKARINAVREALGILASDDTDYARAQNGVGFSRYDARVGHELATQYTLSEGQAQLGYKIVRKYHRQLPQRIKETLGL